MTSFIPDYVETQKRLAKSKGKGLRFRKPTRALIPKGVERQYRSELLKFVREIERLYVEQLFPQLPLIVAEAQLRSDSFRYDANFVGLIQRIAGNVGARLDVLVANRAGELVQRYFDATNNHSKGQLLRQIKSALQIDAFPPEQQLGALMESFKEENLSLIQDLSRRTVEGISETTQRMVRAGERPTTIAEELRRKFKLSEKRAALIARDQVNKLNGQLTRMRQTNLGIEKYVWRTSRDERVRTKHLEREGKVYSWDDPPDGGHPGQEVQCRCYAEPVIEGVPRPKENRQEVIKEVKRKREVLREKLKGKKAARLIAR